MNSVKQSIFMRFFSFVLLSTDINASLQVWSDVLRKNDNIIVLGARHFYIDQPYHLLLLKLQYISFILSIKKTKTLKHKGKIDCTEVSRDNF